MSLRKKLQQTTMENDKVGLKIAEIIKKAQQASDNGEYMIIEYIHSIDLYDRKEIWSEDDLEKMKNILAGEEYELEMDYRTDDNDENGLPVWRIMVDWM